MKIKTSELTGNALCHTICMIEMPHLVWGKTIGLHEHSNQIIVPELRELDCYSPFMGWAQGGPIIEREGIQLHVNEARTEWLGSCWGYSRHQYGATPLIAAMRCYVANKLGDEVEVPDELL